MAKLVLVAQIVLLLALGVLTLSFVMALGTSTSGPAEKLVLVCLVALCIYAATRVAAVGTQWQARLRRR